MANDNIIDFNSRRKAPNAATDDDDDFPQWPELTVEEPSEPLGDVFDPEKLTKPADVLRAFHLAGAYVRYFSGLLLIARRESAFARVDLRDEEARLRECVRNADDDDPSSSEDVIATDLICQQRQVWYESTNAHAEAFAGQVRLLQQQREFLLARLNDTNLSSSATLPRQRLVELLPRSSATQKPHETRPGGTRRPTTRAGEVPETVAKSMARSGVSLDATTSKMRCNTCGTVWSPQILPGGRYARGARLCPSKCNAALLAHR